MYFPQRNYPMKLLEEVASIIAGNLDRDLLLRKKVRKQDENDK